MSGIVNNDSLADQLYNVLKNSIIKGDFMPGDRLIETEIAKMYGVSQAPVREAFSRLNEEDLISSLRYKGHFVSNLSKKDVEEIYSFREIMEVFALERAIERINELDLKKMNQLYHDMVEAGKRQDIERARTVDIEFHTQIYRIADHNFMFKVWEDLSLKSSRVWYLTKKIYFTKLSHVAEIHKPLLDSIEKRDIKQSIKNFKAHLYYVKADLDRIWNDKGEKSRK